MKKVIILLVMISSLLMLMGCSAESMPEKKKQEYLEFRTQMTEEEKQEYIKAHTKEYEVLSVIQYIATKTNGYGGVQGHDLCYAFTYVDENGELKQVDKFKHLEYGLTKVLIGDTNKYVIENGFDDYRYLYLTKETLQNIETK